MIKDITNLNQQRSKSSISMSINEDNMLMSLLTYFQLFTEYENGTQSEINKCYHDDVVSYLEDDYIGEYNIFEEKLKPLNIDQSCLCFKVRNYSLTLVCLEGKLKNDLAEFRNDYKIVKLFRIQNHQNNYCYVLISSLVPHWMTMSNGKFIDGVMNTRLIENGEESGTFLWERLVEFYTVVAL